MRGTAGEIVELLKKGEAELAVAADIDEAWDRLDRWPLFTERFQLLVNAEHRLASRTADRASRICDRSGSCAAPYCERRRASCTRSCAATTSTSTNGHELTSERDLITLLEADFGVAFAPRSMSRPATLKQAPVEGVELDRTVYCLRRGRPRSARRWHRPC